MSSSDDRFRAAFFHHPGEVELRDLPRRPPGDGEVLLRIEACGICGTDAQGFVHDERDWHRRGHEYAATIEEIGPGVERLHPGDRVAGIGSLPCGECPRCLAGSEELCLVPRRALSGGFAEMLAVPSIFVFPAGDLSAARRALIEPLTVALQLVDDAAVRPGGSALIVGAGPIGLMAIAICRQIGARRIYVSQPSHATARVAAARTAGADRVFTPDIENVRNEILAREPDGVESVLVTAPPDAGIPLGAACIAVGGAISYCGVAWRQRVTVKFDIDELHFRRARIVGSNHNPCARLYPRAAALLRANLLDPGLMISHTYPIEEIAKAFETVTHRQADIVKVLVRP